jgi:hypothetical protein
MYTLNMSINTKEDIINYLGHKYNLKNYFEISSVINGFIYDKIDNFFFTKELFLYNPPNNIDLPNLRKDTDIQPIDYNVGIEKYKDNKYDIIFIDSYHTFEQSLLDIEFAYSLLNDNGFIIIHDCSPLSSNLIGDYKSNAWCGQTYSTFIHFRMKTSYIKTSVVNIDFGCGIISKNNLNKDVFKLDNLLTLKEVSQWHYFTNNKKKLLNLISVNEFKKLY